MQATKEEEIILRVKNYNYYLSLTNEIPVATMVILADNDFNWRPSLYEADVWGCRSKLEYLVLKILDFKPQKDELMDSDNIFAVVILCQLAALETEYNASKRKLLKFSLTKTLYLKGWSRDIICSLLKFFDGILRLPEPIQLEYTKEVHQVEEELKVSYVTTFEEFAKREGIQIGRQEGESLVLVSLLESKFGVIPEKYMNRIKQANSDILLTWAKRLLNVQSLSELFDA